MNFSNSGKGGGSREECSLESAFSFRVLACPREEVGRGDKVLEQPNVTLPNLPRTTHLV